MMWQASWAVVDAVGQGVGFCYMFTVKEKIARKRWRVKITICKVYFFRECTRPIWVWVQSVWLDESERWWWHHPWMSMLCKLYVPKKGKDKKNTRSYRPISLLSCVGKLLERMVNQRLINHLESNNVLSPTQTGYRKFRSTEDQLA